MANPANAFQTALFVRLGADAALTAAIGANKVYDHVSQDAAAPYVVIGEDTIVDFDTKTSNGWDVTATIHCWDFEKAGRKSIKNIMGAIYDSLHKQEAALTVTGFTLIMLRCDFQQTIQETAEAGASDHYYHGIMRFRALISET